MPKRSARKCSPLAAVDFVVIFDEATPRELIASLLPDVLVKGADWGTDEIVGREEVEAAGGKVVSIPLEPGYSTTEILEKIRTLPANRHNRQPADAFSGCYRTSRRLGRHPAVDETVESLRHGSPEEALAGLTPPARRWWWRWWRPSCDALS